MRKINAKHISHNRWLCYALGSFSGTAHSFTGHTLKAALVDCLGVQNPVRRDDVLRAYQCISRVSRADDLLIVQPYARWLVRQG